MTTDITKATWEFEQVDFELRLSKKSSEISNYKMDFIDPSKTVRRATQVCNMKRKRPADVSDHSSRYIDIRPNNGNVSL